MVFSRYFFTKKSTERTFVPPQSYMINEEMLGVIMRHTFEANFEMMRVVVNYRKGQKHFIKNCFPSKKYLGQTTDLRPSVT